MSKYTVTCRQAGYMTTDVLYEDVYTWVLLLNFTAEISRWQYVLSCLPLTPDIHGLINHWVKQ